MATLSDLIVFLLLLVLVFASTFLGLWRGKRVRKERAPDGDHLGTIQGALLGLLGLLLGFSFSGTMSRFIERQDALFTEANAVETAYQRAELLPTGDAVRAKLREYASLRLELFHEVREKQMVEITRKLRELHESARQSTMEGVRQSPQFASLAIPGIEGVSDEFARRGAIARRHLPIEMIVVLIMCSCIAMGTIGYGVGLAQRRSIGSVLSLSALIAVTLFVTFDFDRPRKGLIRLDPEPLEALDRSLGRASTAR